MGPLRILILAALLYLGYRLISANFKKDSGEEKKDDSGGREHAEEGTGPVTDVLVEDPVCRKLVPRQQAHTVELDGDVHFFCSRECADAFVASQDKGD